MPASEIMPKFRQGKLHSGKGGRVVKNPKQAKAILLSELRSEGKIPERKKATRKAGARKRA
jgi:hypothetical protein